jgi:hypothetical protein
VLNPSYKGKKGSSTKPSASPKADKADIKGSGTKTMVTVAELKAN